jgi:hypothetical protein
MGPEGVVVISQADTVAGAAQARALDGAVRALVLCGVDGEALGRLARELASRSVVFVGDPGREQGAAALVELVGELFGREVDVPRDGA